MSHSTPAPLPLDGIRVLELGSLIAGPFTGRLLADFGAEVIKIESPDKPDPMRKWGKHKNGIGLWWPIQSRNKRSITLNLREQEGQQLFKKLSENRTSSLKISALARWRNGDSRMKRFLKKMKG